MDPIWWLPTATLVTGSLILFSRLRIAQREIATVDAAITRLGDLAEGGVILSDSVRRAASRRARTAAYLAAPARTDSRSAGSADRGPDDGDR